MTADEHSNQVFAYQTIINLNDTHRWCKTLMHWFQKPDSGPFQDCISAFLPGQKYASKTMPLNEWFKLPTSAHPTRHHPNRRNSMYHWGRTPARDECRFQRATWCLDVSVLLSHLRIVITSRVHDLVWNDVCASSMFSCTCTEKNLRMIPKGLAFRT